MGASFMGALGRFECWMGTQAAQNWILMLNLIAVGIYVCFTRKIYQASDKQAKATQDLARSQRQQWELDSRKEEWRELIDTLTQCFHKVELAKASLPYPSVSAPPQWVVVPGEARRALLEAVGVISNRLFIKDVLEKERVREDWREIELMSEGSAPVSRDHTAGVAGSAGVTDLQQKWVTLHRKLVRAALTDLGVTVGGLDTVHG